ncbi:hypothetical protein G4W71_04925 [Clostridium botulinum]|uniref:hypothetical protein n=1 Tax=Clostridium botulinum TaxID=1491 RepID=UPI001360B431|nr:hypothetical protein [Clostridium botulinum]MBE1303383.1 hypothetical protein [Clostridium botulinum]
MNKIININLQEKIDEFPENIREIAIGMIEQLNKNNISRERIEEDVLRKINKLVIKEI